MLENGNARDQSEASARIARAVERETLRRKRVLRIYLALLVLPVLLAAVTYFFARSDHESVRQTARQEAQEVVKPVSTSYQEEIKPALTQLRTLDGSIAIVNNAAEELEQQQQRIENLEGFDQEIRPSLERLDGSLTRLESATEQLDSHQRQIQRIEGTLEEMAPALRRLEMVRPRLDRLQHFEEELAEQRRGIEEIFRRQRELDEQVEEQDREIQRIRSEIRVLRPGELGTIQNRLQILERETETMRQFSNELKRRIDRLPQRPGQ